MNQYSKSELESAICKAFEKTLNIDHVNSNDNFIKLGGNIFKAQQVVKDSSIENLPVEFIMLGLTPESISDIILSKGLHKPALEVEEKDAFLTGERFPMTPSMLYNYYCSEASEKDIDWMDLRAVWELNDDVDLLRLKNAVSRVFLSYPGINIGFLIEDEQFVKRDTDPASYNISIIEMPEEEFPAHVFDLVNKKRDMLKDDMAYISIVKTEVKAYLCIRMTHLIHDGQCFGPTIIKGISNCYSGKDPVSEQATAFDLGRQQKRIYESGFYDEALSFYRDKFDGCPKNLRNSIEPTGYCAFLPKSIGQLTNADLKSYMKANALSFNIVLQAAYIFAIASEMKWDTFSYKVFHGGRYEEKIETTLSSVARAFFMVAKIDKEQPVLDFLKNLQSQYYETMYYDVVPMTAIDKKFNGIDSGILFNYRGSMINETSIKLDDKPNQFTMLGYIYGAKSEEEMKTNSLIELMIDKVGDDFNVSGNSGYFKESGVDGILHKLKRAMELVNHKQNVGQIIGELNME